ncbi:MAG: beta-ketoacyl-[acyl-carrier-protein] synthase family protein [Candidatus Rokubacteria bacterium]|nr:beta-ketoacyl-[acyl-carrier-protein] synthase family protein [Candidatus Rokubacteria bacterium]
MSRVVITGLGVVSPVGTGAERFWRSLVEGRSGVGRIGKFDPSGFPVQLGAEVRDFDPGAIIRGEDPKEAIDLATCFALAAAEMAWADAGLTCARVDPERIGLSLGVSSYHVPDYREIATLAQRAAARVPAALNAETLVEESLRTERGLAALSGASITPALFLGRRLPIRGPVTLLSTACAGGAQAIGEAKRCLERGQADLVLAGGSEESVNPIKLLFFHLLGALSTRNDAGAEALCPFDARRDGTVLADGAGIVVLERLAHAARRGARIYAELVGYGASCDAYRLTDSHPEGLGGALAMTRALSDAGLPPERIDYINAHGTATWVNDRIETLAIRRVFGPHANKIPVSSTKSMTGHLVTASGAVECIATALTLVRQVIPPTINYQAPDPECDLDYVPNVARGSEVTVALSNAFGFGGQNATLILHRGLSGRDPC